MKFHKFLHTLPMKLYLLLLGLILFSFFSNDFGLVDIQKTAIILAAAIDRTEKGYSVTAQIAVPKNADRSTGGTSSVEIEAEGSTVSDCVTLIFSKTGWVPKLVFCNLILIGEDAAREDVISDLNYFLRNEYMNDSCYLAVSEGKASELLSSKSATDDTSSLAIVKIFSEAAEKSGRVLPNTLKDFAIGYFGVSKSGYLPYIRATAQQESGQHGTSDAATAGGTGSGQEEKTGEEKIYSAQETAIFSEGKMVGILSSEQTIAYSLLRSKVHMGTVTAKDGEEPVTLTVVSDNGKVSLDMKGAPTVKLKVSLIMRLCCRGTTAPIEDISSEDVKPEILKSAENILTGYIMELWNFSRERGCDLFCLKQDLYRSSLKKFREWEPFLLETVKPDVSLEVKSMK